MALTVHISKGDLESINRALAGIPKGAEKAVRMALNEANLAMKATALRAITRSLFLSKKTVSKVMPSLRADHHWPSAVTYIRGAKFPLIAFPVDPNRPLQKGQARPPVGVRALLGPSRSQVYPGSFIGTGKLKSKKTGRERGADPAGTTGALVVFKRTGRARNLLTRPYSPSLLELVDGERVIEVMKQRGLEVLKRRLDHHVQRLLSQGSAAHV